MPWFVKIEKGIVDKATFDRYVSAHKDYVRDLIRKDEQQKLVIGQKGAAECYYLSRFS
jgi:hypothetical protein